VTSLRDHLESRRAAGRKLLVPYVMAGLPTRASWPEVVTAVSAHADTVEVGLPYSDPLMDGPVIAAAGERAIAAGIGPLEAVDLAAEASGVVPRAVMTYYNPIHHAGEGDFCRRVAKAGAAGLIVPDLPVEESASLRRVAREEGLAWIPMVAPTSSPARVEAIASTATGFVYAVSTLGVTGERRSLAESAARVTSACRAATDLPVVVGIGVSTPEQAVEACAEADGVVVGTAVVKRVLDEGPAAAGAFLASVRAALDGV
jgi:tryptophan synthase alpha chain